ncbi:MAG: hypothetical protein ACRCXZ_07160, partial [Patescibacteria group bacterium]
RAIVESFKNFGAECVRNFEDNEPGYLDSSLGTYALYLDKNWLDIQFNAHLLHAHNMLLEFCNFVCCRFSGLFEENLEEAVQISKHTVLLEDKNVENWKIIQYLDNYVKYICPTFNLTKSRFGYILETYPLHCVRELLTEKNWLKVLRFGKIVELVILTNKLRLTKNPELCANIAGYGFESSEISSFLHDKDQDKHFDFLNCTSGLENFDREWLESFVNFEYLAYAYSRTELETILNSLYAEYFHGLNWFLGEILPSLVKNRVHQPAFKKLTDNLKLLTKQRKSSQQCQQKQIDYFEEKLVFGYLCNNPNMNEAKTVLRTLQGPKSKCLIEVCRLLNLNTEQALNLNKQSVHYLAELYREQYKEVCEYVQEAAEVYSNEEDKDFVLTSEMFDLVEQKISTKPTYSNKSKPESWINAEIFDFNRQAIDFTAFERPAVKRTFQEVERVLYLAKNSNRSNQLSLLDQFKSIVIFPDIHGQSASLLRNKVSLFHANTSRIKIGDVEVKLSEEHRLFLREAENDNNKVSIVELSNPKYHH